jgi:hypothetical protein
VQRVATAARLKAHESGAVNAEANAVDAMLDALRNELRLTDDGSMLSIESERGICAVGFGRLVLFVAFSSSNSLSIYA